MRMTRAALRAQEAEEELQAKIEVKLREQGIPSQNSDNVGQPLIHEDAEDQDIYISSRDDIGEDEEQDHRPALRDITTDNYPVAETDPFVTSETAELEMKDANKTKTKKGPKTSAKKNDIVIKELQAKSLEECEESQDTNSQSAINAGFATKDLQEVIEPSAELKQLPEAFTQKPDFVSALDNAVDDNELPQQDALTEPLNYFETDVSEVSAPTSPKTPFKATINLSKTPKFNPEVHLLPEKSMSAPSDETEDSFVDSIKTRSPSKHSQSVSESQHQGQCNSFASPTITRTPSKTPSLISSSSPSRIEDSVEAIDALEDAIEKIAEELPILDQLPPESPVKLRNTPARKSARTPAKISMKTPAKTPGKPSAKTPAKVLTPATVSAKGTTKTPANTATPKIRTPSSRKVEGKTLQTLEEKMASVKRETVKERVKAIESRPEPSAHRRATSVHVLKKDAPEIKTTLKSRHMATKSVPAISTAPVNSMSFSNSPVKQSVDQPKKRATSGGVLSTSKPGFVPTKSSKPTTTSTFTLPGESIAVKLRTQREERLKKEEAEAGKKKPVFKAKPAPERAARPSVMPRENKASAARMSVRQASGENKENVAPARSSSVAGPATGLTSTTAKPNTSRATANSSVRRTTIAPKSSSTVESRKSAANGFVIPTHTSQRITSLSSGQPIALTKTELAQQKLKGKEVYSRIKSSAQQLEEERKTKEEAARKARAEAAERGRQASREWAEKHKKKMEAANPKAPSVAMVTG